MSDQIGKIQELDGKVLALAKWKWFYVYEYVSSFENSGEK